jgi:hypothetical protein
VLISGNGLVVNDLDARVFDRLSKQGGDVDTMVLEFGKLNLISKVDQ